MSKASVTPDRLFDRAWRPWHPFRPRISRARRWGMGIICIVLFTIIGGYSYLTDSNRVRGLAESYLSELLGGPVKVGNATLSVFQGLKLDDVKLNADTSNSPQSLLFSASSFQIKVDPRALLWGKLEATTIVAVEPRVHISEDIATGRRNYAGLLESHAPTSMPSSSPSMPMILPEIILRNAHIEYSRWQGKEKVESSSIAIEGQLKPSLSSKVYTFNFQSRGGKLSEIGPVISGQMVMGTGQVQASLQNFKFGPDVKAMLPPEVQRWWQQHELSGQLNIPVLSFNPPEKPGDPSGYKVQIELEGVTLSVHPEEWMSAEQNHSLDNVRGALDVLRMAGLNDKFVSRLDELAQPAPMTLKQVHGQFTFSDNQNIEIKDLRGWLEEMPFEINGEIKGYSPDAEAHLELASQLMQIPAVPRYLNSLPPNVREIYDRFKPNGTCGFDVHLDRPAAGATPIVTGRINILNGNFAFERFPYPLRNTSGQIVVDNDPSTGQQRLILDHIHGKGIEGGPNTDTTIQVNGMIAPLGPDCRVDVIVSGQNINSEPALLAAFPPLTRKAMTLFDAPGKGEFPKFSGDFACTIVRLRGLESHWIVETDVRLDQAAGALVAFPYPMSGVQGELKIRDDHVELINVHMNRDDASLRIDGRVYWPTSDQLAAPAKPSDKPTLRPDLKIMAKNVQIDKDLLAALPAKRSEWLKKLGARGKFDLDGTIKPATAAEDDLDFDLRVAMHDGAMWPTEDQAAVTNVNSEMHISNQRLTLTSVTGKRGNSDISARGEVNWQSDTPGLILQAKANNLAVDPALYKLMSQPVKTAWDQVRPQGTVDLSLNYSGIVADQSSSASTTQPAGYEVVITPKKLSANLLSVPYQLDDVAGTVTVLPDRVLLKDLTAHHGRSVIRLAGSGSTGPQQAWDLTLSGQEVAVDDPLRQAVPQTLADVLQSIQLQGRIGFEFSKLHVNFPPQPQAPPQVDWAARLDTDGATMDVGVPLSDVKGSMAFLGTSSNGKLTSLNGKLNVDSFTLAGRSVTRFSADLLKDPSHDYITVGRMEGRVAKGGLAGQIDFAPADQGPGRYVVNLQLRDADVKELSGEDQDIQGRISASLALEGTVDQINSRRGRGDVSVTGRSLYRIPLVLGLLQITNLSLPVNRPFTEGSARYSIDGSKVTFEQLELRAKEMLMQGDGNLDFGTKQVRMRFVTDSTAWPKLPLVGDLIQGAQHELLQIQVRGTLEEPRVSARAMNTITTTVDEVLKADSVPAPSRKK
ncbi:MAG TPA: hypothetical protein VHD56_07420 [Tepidisphaeraceae bacterium]|nr:hypothetical protein [Tepidisphaeraceae bacterium]